MKRIPKKTINSIIEILGATYPQAKTALNYETPFQFLTAAILSAQCTDARVNIVTADLFARFKTASDFTKLSQDELIGYIKPCGFFRNKSKNIIACAKIISDKFAGILPADIDLLTRLPGVGRKTANIVLSNIYNIPAIAVDTHVFRVSRRIGLSVSDTPDKVEQDLMYIIPEKNWSSIHHQLIYLGRSICSARKPKCGICPLNKFCGYTKSHVIL